MSLVPHLRPLRSLSLRQGWRLYCFPKQPVLVLSHRFHEENLPSIQSQPPLLQLETTSLCDITFHFRKESGVQLTAVLFLGVAESNEVSPPFLQKTQPQFPQLPLVGFVFQFFQQIRYFSLSESQHLHILFVAGGPKLTTALLVCSVTPGWVQRDNHNPRPAGHIISDAV